MIKKKTKKKTAPKKTTKKKSQAHVRAGMNPAEVRKEVAKMVEAGATEIAQAVIDEALKGQVAPTKYLFEMASIYPPAPDGTQATTEEDCLAKILLDRLKLAARPEEKSEGAAGEAAGVERVEDGQNAQLVSAQNTETSVERPSAKEETCCDEKEEVLG